MAGETIRDVIIRIGIENKADVVQAPDFSPTQQALEKLDSKYNESATVATQAFEEIADASEITLEDIENLREEVEDLAESSGKTSLEMAGHFRTMGEGAFTFARGAVLSFSDTEEGAAEMLKTVAKVQGAFDLFKGTIDVLTGLSAVKGVLTAATIAQSTATGIAAGATAAEAAAAATATPAELAHTAAIIVKTTALGIMTAATAAATAAVVALEIALGPIGVILLAIGAAAAVLGGLWAWVTDTTEDVEDQTEAWKKLNEQMKQNAIDRFNLATSRASDRDAIASKAIELAMMKENITAAEKLKLIEQERIDSEKRLLQLTGAGQAHTLEELSSRIKLVQAGKDRNIDQASLLEMTKVQTTLLNQREEAERQNLQVIRDQALAKAEVVRKQQEGLELARDQLKTENDRLTSIDALLGKLDPQQLKRLQQLQGKVEGGEQLKGFELQELQGLIGGTREGSKFIEQQFAAIGAQRREAGGIDLGRTFGGRQNRGQGSEQSRLEDQLERQIEETGGLVNFADRLDAITRERKDQEKQVVDKLKTLIEEQKMSQLLLETLEDRQRTALINQRQ